MSAPATATIPSLDGIRAVAVLLVFLAHSGLEHLVPGGLGVTLFFVLSGYLISTLMRIEHRDRNRIDFKGFYLRRILRLMPPLLVIVALAALLAQLALIDGRFTPNGFLAVVFYWGNYFVIARDFDGMPAGLGVVWSLAVEEHFYLFYPPLAALLLRVSRAGTTAIVLVALCLAVLTWRYWLAVNGAPIDYLTMATDTRVDAILIGCLLALWRNPWLDPPKRSASWIDAVAVVAALSVLIFTLAYRNEFFRVTARHTVQSAALAVLLYYAVARADRAPFRWLNTAPLVYIGSLSYTIYLSHHMILLLINKHQPTLGWLPTTLGAIALTWLVAEPMRRWIEAPCARLRRRLHDTQPPSTVGSSLTSPITSRGVL
jgi:peptidoglycan/LPS O-acetylase OafA/YrhL